MAEKQYGYSAPRQLHENLWELSGQWSNKLGRRMTVIRLADGRVIIHNAFELKDAELRWLSELGKVAYIIAPNIFHCSDAGWMKARFPSADLYVPRKKFISFEGEGHLPNDVGCFPDLGELKGIPMDGTKIEESAFFHFPSRTLILCDLAFNMADEFRGIGRLIMKWNKVGGRFGPSRLTKLLFTRNKESLLASNRKLLEHYFDRVIVNHGEILESGGKERLKSGVEEIFGSF